ncbi:MAG: hypothetical protein P8L47_00810 [Candidatus Marinamargulisbacteria bacterium]|nr:hypothetical protein [bacterium]MDG2264640.1 hypothetical protein [Candidatus Marinamargulisbacteria bacterium]|tara:strand:- start:3301 stop:4221 length:921 start_codon:yes stop_codon:yes gene_type:complete
MSYQKIQNALDDNDHNAFLIQYFETIYSGVDLPIPSGLDIDRIQQGWKKIFDEVIEIKVPDTFISALGKQWQTIINQQGGTVDDNFVIEILALLTGSKPPQKEPKAIQTPTQPSTQSSTIIPSTKRFYPKLSKTGERRDLPPLDDESVDAAISQTYRSNDAVSDIQLPALTPKRCAQLNQALREHYAATNALAFLTDFFMLSFADDSEYSPPPISGESWQIFQTHWQDILLLLMDKPGHNDFIQRLRPLWLSTYQKIRQLPAGDSACALWLAELQSIPQPSPPKPQSGWLTRALQRIQNLLPPSSS